MYSKRKHFRKLHCSKAGTEGVFRIPYAQSHKFICVSPDDYEAMLNYVDEVLDQADFKTKTLLEPFVESIGETVE